MSMSNGRSKWLENQVVRPAVASMRSGIGSCSQEDNPVATPNAGSVDLGQIDGDVNLEKCKSTTCYLCRYRRVQKDAEVSGRLDGP